MGEIKLKSYAWKYESEALKMLQKEYELCIRIPMSLAPFDILCVDKNKGIVAFVEVKYGKSSLTENQKTFKNVIESRNNWHVKYIVFRVNEK